MYRPGPAHEHPAYDNADYTGERPAYAQGAIYRPALPYAADGRQLIALNAIVPQSILPPVAR